jgi:AcrR family transcriptional regulator
MTGVTVPADAPARRRVAPLAPDDRRAALIEATLPLLLESGTAVSTRQIASAAGVAEGTIFRVFPDKTSLILAAVRVGVDPEPAERALRAIPADLDLRARLTRAATMMVAGMREYGRLHVIARELAATQGPDSEFGAELHKNHLRVQAAVATVFEPDRDGLRLAPTSAARLMMLYIVGMGGLAIGEAERVDPADIVTVILDGLLIRATETRSTSDKEPPC